MKYLLLFFFVFSCALLAQSPLENSVITSEKNKTEIHTDENGVLFVNVSPDDVLKFKSTGSVRYSDFGATGDGKIEATGT